MNAIAGSAGEVQLRKRLLRERIHAGAFAPSVAVKP
jgi:hypothetical protein